ncbi:MAG TPA: LysR family transcriptional regulator [Solirubrobacteraceae bacterium]|nr:LysR family transcriptional regulator [Solirubrobacteraceae bacterium]
MSHPSSQPPTHPVAGRDLLAFVVAVETGSLQATADALALTQSAVTKRIHSLEAYLGALVLRRSPHGVSPTELGARIYPPAKEALRQLEIVTVTAAAARHGSRGALRLSASLTTGEFLLPAWLSIFRSERPDVHPHLKIVNSTAALSALRDGDSEIAFIESAEAPVEFEMMTVATDSLAVVVSSRHRWSRRSSLRPDELTAEPYLTRERDSGTRGVATAALARAGVELVPSLEVASIQSLKRSIRDSGFTILSRLAVGEEEQAGALVTLDIDHVDLARELRAVRIPGRTPEPAARDFWDWLTARRTGRAAVSRSARAVR